MRKPLVAWFNDNGDLIKEIPADCIEDCARPGQSAENSVTFWAQALNFTVPREPAIHWLKDFGAWPVTELYATPNDELAKRVLWLLCCAHTEYPEIPLTLRR